MPALHWAMTSSGPDTMKSGAPITGNTSRSSRTEGMAKGGLHKLVPRLPHQSETGSPNRFHDLPSKRCSRTV